MSSKKIKNVKQSLKEVVALTVLIIVLLIMGLFRYLNSNAYQVEKRVEKVKTQQKKDTKDIKTVSWIRVQGTNIDYPVIYAPDADFSYMTDDFAWTEADYKGLNNIVYISGHNIKNMSANPIIGDKTHNRFEQLMAFVYYDFVKDNQYFQYTINENDYIYQIFAIGFYDGVYLDLYNDKPYNNHELKEYIQDVKDNSIFDFGIAVNENDKLISLTTCTRMFGLEKTHFVVTGKLMEKGSIIKLNKVKKTSKYKEVLDEMKGGDSYDET